MTVKFTSETVQKHSDLSDKIKTGLSVEGAKIKETESHATYYDNLPEGIDRKQVEELSKYNGKYVTAAHVAVGEVAADIFKKDPKAETVEAAIGFFGKTDVIEMSVARTKQYQNHLAENEADKEITKHLVIKTTVTTQSSKGYGLKAVRDSMSKEFEGHLSK